MPPYDIGDTIAELPEAIALFQKILAGVKTLPSPSTKVKPVMDLAATLLPDLGALIDRVRTDIAT